MQTSSKLAKRYGKLSVTATEVIDGRTMAHVKCKCGRTKSVLAESLRRGNTKSCGNPPCKYDTQKPDKSFRPRRPRAMTMAQVKRFWKAYHRPANRLTLEAAAEKFDVNYHTLDSLLRSIRKCGGIDRYVELIEGT